MAWATHTRPDDAVIARIHSTMRHPPGDEAQEDGHGRQDDEDDRHRDDGDLALPLEGERSAGVRRGVHQRRCRHVCRRSRGEVMKMMRSVDNPSKPSASRPCPRKGGKGVLFKTAWSWKKIRREAFPLVNGPWADIFSFSLLECLLDSSTLPASPRARLAKRAVPEWDRAAFWCGGVVRWPFLLSFFSFDLVEAVEPACRRRADAAGVASRAIDFRLGN